MCQTPNRQKMSNYCMNDSNYDNFQFPKHSSKIAASCNFNKAKRRDLFAPASSIIDISYIPRSALQRKTAI
jgi:hypothetical protein